MKLNVIAFFCSAKLERQPLKAPNKATVCRGQIVQLDTEIVFQARSQRGGMVRLSYEGIRKEDYVSNKELDPRKLQRGKTLLLYEDLEKCLIPTTFYQISKSGLFIISVRPRNLKRIDLLRYANNSYGKMTS